MVSDQVGSRNCNTEPVLRRTKYREIVVGISRSISRSSSVFFQSLSVLMINVLMSNFFSRTTDDHFFDSAASWSMFGLNWMQILRSSSQVTRKGGSECPETHTCAVQKVATALEKVEKCN